MKKNLCKIYYGLSGTFKGTTITEAKKEGDSVLWSNIKLWKSYESGLFSSMTGERNDLNYAMLHLCELGQLTRNLSFAEDSIFYVERGITDMDYYYIKNTGCNEGSWIKESVQEELRLLDDFEVQKILLIQKDYDFIRDVVLSEKTRAYEFTGPSDYLEKQKAYVEFTEKYNKIDEKIIISSAKDYIEGLGLKYKITTNKNN